MKFFIELVGIVAGYGLLILGYLALCGLAIAIVYGIPVYLIGHLILRLF